MTKTIDPRLVELLKSYGEDNTSVWDCHGTWVAYHAAIERMAAKANVQFNGPEMIVNDYEKKTVVVCVSARMGSRVEWSFGEVSPANNKNAYPYAMAEKRAKDRVALKLLGMAGLVYSEEEADDFKESKPAPEAPKPVAKPKAETFDPDRVMKYKTSAGLKKEGAWEDITKSIANEMLDVPGILGLERLRNAYRETVTEYGWPTAWKFQLRDVFDGYEDRIKQQEFNTEDDTVSDIQDQFPGACEVNETHPLMGA